MDPSPDFDQQLADRLDAALAGFWRGDASAFTGLLGEQVELRDMAEMVRGASEAAPPAETPIPRIRGYEFVRELGRGGMGVVFEAAQRHPQRQVAIKVILGGHFAGDTRTRLFQREVHALARLQHPGIAAIYDAGRTEDGHDYLVMELVRGAGLLDFANGHGGAPLTITQRLRLFIQVCQAISFAHQRGVIHRDIKPGNILVDADGMPKVLDFGLARFLDDSAHAATLITEPGRVIGTLAYMSPEQAAGRTSDVDTRSDVYSLGVVLFELLTGQRPYDVSRSAVHHAVQTICETAPGRPSALNRTIRGDLETVMLKALEKEPSRRYQTAQVLADDLERFLKGEAIAARPPTAMYQLRVFARKNKTFVISFLIIIASLVGGIVATMREAHRAQLAEADAISEKHAAEDARATVEKDAKNVSALNSFFLKSILESAFPNRLGASAKIMDAVDSAMTGLSADFKDHPLTEARICHYVGNIYQLQGRFKEAEPLLRRAALLWHREIGDKSFDTIDTDAWLARLLIATGRLKEAEQLHRHNLEIVRDFAPDRPYRIADGVSAVAGVLMEEGRFAEAEPLYREGLKLDLKVFGPEHGATAAMTAMLANCLMEQGKTDAAESVYRDSLAQVQARFPRSTGHVQYALRRLAQFLNGIGKSAEARQLARDNLEETRKTADGGEMILSAEQTLSMVLQTSTDEALRDEAVKLYQHTTDYWIQRRGLKSIYGVVTLRDLAICQQRVGRPKDALKTIDKAFDAEQNTFFADRYRNYLTTVPFGEIGRAAGKLEDASVHTQAEYGRRHDTRGPAASDTREALFAFAECLAVTDGAEKAEDYIVQQWQLALHHFDKLHPDMIAWRAQLADFCRRHRPPAVAEQRYREWFEPQITVFGPLNRESIRSRIELAEVLCVQAKFEEARRLLDEGATLATKTFGPQHPWTTRLTQARENCDKSASTRPAH